MYELDPSTQQRATSLAMTLSKDVKGVTVKVHINIANGKIYAHYHLYIKPYPNPIYHSNPNPILHSNPKFDPKSTHNLKSNPNPNPKLKIGAHKQIFD